MDDTYYRYPVGSQEHYAAYERYFISNDGIDAAVPGNPQASYEADNAYELAYERENEHLAQKDAMLLEIHHLVDLRLGRSLPLALHGNDLLHQHDQLRAVVPGQGKIARSLEAVVRGLRRNVPGHCASASG